MWNRALTGRQLALIVAALLAAAGFGGYRFLTAPASRTDTRSAPLYNTVVMEVRVVEESPTIAAPRSGGGPAVAPKRRDPVSERLHQAALRRRQLMIDRLHESDIPTIADQPLPHEGTRIPLWVTLTVRTGSPRPGAPRLFATGELTLERDVYASPQAAQPFRARLEAPAVPGANDIAPGDRDRALDRLADDAARALAQAYREQNDRTGTIGP